MKTAFCFDLDGTVTQEEILPLLAKEVNLYEEISALTEATIKGVIPFKKSFLLRCRLLNDIPVERIQNIISKVKIYQEICSFIKKNASNSYIITGNLDIWIKKIEKILPCQFYSSLGKLNPNGSISVEHVLEKGSVIEHLRKKHSKIVSVGDGMGDVPMFEKSDIRIAFGGTHKPIQSLIQHSDYIIFCERALCNLLSNMQ
jgi:HAD superfamily phosphoserine phosphatase-like hydrolase